MSPKSRQRTFQGLAILIAVGVIVLACQPWQTAPLQSSPPTTQSVAGVSTSLPDPEDVPVSENFNVYFTNPAKKFTENTGDGIEKQLIAKINTAKTSLHGAFFEFDLQNVADALIAAKNRGVDVQLVYDNEHTDADPQMAEMIQAGIKAIPDERSAFMHNKFLVVDSKCVWTGSFNLTVNAAYKNNENAIYLCNQNLAENYQVEFTEMFNGQFGPSSPANTPYPQITIDGIMVENYFAPEDEVLSHVLESVKKAQTSIHFLAFSFTDDKLGDQMLLRQLEGVSVKGVFESRGSSAKSSQCSQFQKNGADIRLDGNSYTMHHKIIIIDSQVVIVGSFNFTTNANNSNDENLLIIHSAALAQKYESEFQKIYSQGVTSLAGCKSP